MERPVQLVAVITKDRVIDASLRERIKNKKLYICQHHFTVAQYFRHETKTTINPGVIPTLNLPVLSHSSSTQPRPHGHMSLLKKTRRNGPGVGHPRDLILLVEKKVHFPGRITQDVI